MKSFSLLRVIPLISVVCVLLAVLCCCDSTQKAEYYSQKENYISVTGVVTGIRQNEEADAFYIDFSDLSPVLDDTCFKIVGENAEIVKANKIDEKIKIGEQITFITAPKYFGDGYVMPIVAISTKDETLLGFEEGYKNLLDWLS